MVSDFRPLPRERCSLELRVRYKPSTTSCSCTFREDVQRTSKEFLESSSDTLPDPCHSSFPIHLLISDTLCGWTLADHHLEAAAAVPSIRRKKYLISSSHQNNNCENNLNLDADADNIHGSRKKRRTQTTESVENSSNPRRIGKQNPSSTSGLPWKSCINEGTDCYRPDNREYIQWKVSARTQLRDGIEKQSGKSRDRSSPGDTASKPDAESQPLQEHHVVEEKEDVEEEEAGKVENDHVTHFFGFGSSKDARLQLGDVLVSRSIREEVKEERVRNGRCLVIGQLRASSLRRGVGLPEERPSLPPILSQSRFSHPSQPSERRRLELGKLSVEGVQFSEAPRKCEEDVEEEDEEEKEDGGKQIEDGSREEQQEEEKQEEEVEEKEEEEDDEEKKEQEEEEVKEKEKEKEEVEVVEKEEVEVEAEDEVEEEEAGEKQESESEDYDVFDSNDSSIQNNSGFNFERYVRDGRTEVVNGCRSNERQEDEEEEEDDEEETSTQLYIDFNQSSEVGQDEDDTNSSLSLKVDEGRQHLRQMKVTDRLRSNRNPDSNFEDRKKGESLTGVLTISGICPRNSGSDGSLPSSSDIASGCSSEFKNGSNLDANRRSGVIIEDRSIVHDGSDEKALREKLCLDFRRSPGDDHSLNQPGGLPRLRVVKGSKPHRSRSPQPGPSRNDVEITKVVGVTFGGQTGHVTPSKRDVAADMTSPEEVFDTSSSSTVKKCDVIKYLTQSNCSRGFPNGFHPQPIGLHHRSRKRIEVADCSNGDVSLISSNANIDGKLPLITVTKVQRFL